MTCLEPDDWVREALRRVGRHHDDDAVFAVRDAIEGAAGQPDRLSADGVDSDAEHHRDVYHAVFTDAGIDARLADALYAVESDPRYNQFALDAAPTIRGLALRGCRIGVISDIHFDLRPAFRAANVFEPVDAFVLSFEHGVQKPDSAIFRIAIDALGTEAEETLMVGDRASHDGPAVDVGLPTLLLPPLTDPRHARLAVVTAIMAARTD